jgi:hypothetical protein
VTCLEGVSELVKRDQLAELDEDASARFREQLVLRGCSIVRRSSRPASGARRCQDPGKMAP